MASSEMAELCKLVPEGIVREFHASGCGVVREFASAEEMARMKAAALDIAERWDGRTTTVFRTDAAQTSAQGSDDYFISSAREVRCFWEADAEKEKKESGDLTLRQINKIGHGLHVSEPVFRDYAHSSKVRTLVRALGLQDPVLPQSMYILKNPVVGGEVTAHQDSSFLFTTPKPTCLGLWLALDDVTMDNGNLWVRRGSHTEPVRRHFQRRAGKDGVVRMQFEQLVPDEAMSALEGKALCEEDGGADAEDGGADAEAAGAEAVAAGAVGVEASSAEAAAGAGAGAGSGAGSGQEATRALLRSKGFEPVLCKAGDLVLIHGQVEHLSLRNTSDLPRHTFQLHLVEGPAHVQWSPLNWLQYPDSLSFPSC